MKKNKWLFVILFIVITVLIFGAIITQSKSFDKEILLNDLKNANVIWLILAVFAMFSNIFFESLALKEIIKVICPNYSGKGRYLLYSSADIFFSTITPFTSGGQPATAYFMLKDNISVAGVTVSLILDYIACTLTNLFGFFIGSIFLFKLLGEFSTLSIILVIIGGLGLIIMNVGLFLLLFKANIFKKITTGCFNLLNKLFHYKSVDNKIEKLNKTIDDYKQCSLIMKQNKKMVIKVFIYTFLQKLGKTISTVFVFFAIQKEYLYGFKVWFIQVVSDLGSSLVPIPGGQGAREYILIDGFSKLEVIDSPANLCIVCDAVAFYLSVFISGLIVLLAVIISKQKAKKENKSIEK